MQYLVKSINETCPQSIISGVLYNITVLIGVDQDDAFWLEHAVRLQSSAMLLYQVNLRVHRYTRHKTGKLPFNSLMQDAFDTNADYLVRVNDDTQFETRGWIPRAVNQLMAFVPANVGVVGPVCHQGNNNIMTHDMVHRTHLHIFPTYYPSVFHNWYIDDWISTVYGSARTMKMKTWQVHHHVELGTRYTPALDDKLLLAGEVAAGAVKISGYLQGNTLDARQLVHEEHVAGVKIIVLCKDRAVALKRLLDSLENTDYSGDTVHILVRIDYSAKNKECVAVARDFKFSWGVISYLLSSRNKGLRDSWFEAWHPQAHERAIILEDDIKLSKEWYKWLKAAWQSYGDRTDLAGISLQRQTLVPKHPSHQNEITNEHEPFLYALVGSIGFSPHWKHWMAFRAWIASVDIETVDLKIPDLVTTNWFYSGPRSIMWTQYFVWFCKQHDLFTLYVNLPEKKTLAAHMRERGAHHAGNQGQDFEVAVNVAVKFPNTLHKYGWDGKRMVSDDVYPPVNDASVRPEIPPGRVDSSSNPTRYEPGKLDINVVSHLHDTPESELQYRQLVLNIKKMVIPVAASLFSTLKTHTAHSNSSTTPFLFVIMANHAFVPLIQNWLCNTALMPGVHARTLIIFTDDGDKALADSLVETNFLVQVVRLHLNMPPEFAKDMDYNTYGYWRLVQVRVQLVLEIMKGKIPILLCEPDALWVSNPLLDTSLSSEEEIIGFDDGGVTGFGWLRLLPTANVISMFTELEHQFSNSIRKGHALRAHDPMSIPGGEQAILYKLVKYASQTVHNNITFKMLSTTKYVSGLWYDGGVGGDGSKQRAACKADGELTFFTSVFCCLLHTQNTKLYEGLRAANPSPL